MNKIKVLSGMFSKHNSLLLVVASVNNTKVVFGFDL